MVTVWGSVEAKDSSREEILRLSVAHVHRSRKEPGCIHHSVHFDVENENRLVFFEEWENTSALRAHFSVAESIAFIAAVTKLAVHPPTIKIFESTPINDRVF